MLAEAAEAGYDFDWLRISGAVNDHASRAAREGDPALVATAAGRAFEAGDLLLIAHLDSATASPGADDNASGMAMSTTAPATLPRN